MASDLSFDGYYFQIRHEGGVPTMRAIAVYVANDRTLVCRSCDDPQGHMSVILSHLTKQELDMLMETTGEPVVSERKTA